VWVVPIKYHHHFLMSLLFGVHLGRLSYAWLRSFPRNYLFVISLSYQFESVCKCTYRKLEILCRTATVYTYEVQSHEWYRWHVYGQIEAESYIVHAYAKPEPRGESSGTDISPLEHA